MKLVKFLSFTLVAALVSIAAFAGEVSMTIGDFAYLPDCGGSVRVNNGGNDNQVNLVFAHVKECSNFDILADNRGEVLYSNKKLQGSDRDRSASFTLPKKAMERGFNSVVVVVKSNSGAHKDYVEVLFRKTGGGKTRDVPRDTTGGW